MRRNRPQGRSWGFQIEAGNEDWITFEVDPVILDLI